jgi:glycosyltransferase involved in cell wall biosynthesis
MRAAREATGDLADSIHILGEIPYADIRRYYQEASLCVFPSHLETFGHPILEALAADVPLVAADIPVFHEIAGNAAFYGDPFETKSLANAMEAALFEPGAAELLVKRGRERLKLFTWEQTAERLVSMFHSVLAEREARRSTTGIFALPRAQRQRVTTAAVTGLLHRR